MPDNEFIDTVVALHLELIKRRRLCNCVGMFELAGIYDQIIQDLQMYLEYREEY